MINDAHWRPYWALIQTVISYISMVTYVPKSVTEKGEREMNEG